MTLPDPSAPFVPSNPFIPYSQEPFITHQYELSKPPIFNPPAPGTSNQAVSHAIPVNQPTWASGNNITTSQETRPAEFELTTPNTNSFPEKQQNIPVNPNDTSSDKTLAESAREILSGPFHEAWKGIGILGKNTLLLIEDLNPSISIGPDKGKTLREAWETEAVPSVHEKIDQLFSTNIKDDFDPKKDGAVEQVLQNFFLNPLTGLGGAASTEKVVSQGVKAVTAEKIFGNAGRVFANEALVTEEVAAIASRQVVALEKVDSVGAQVSGIKIAEAAQLEKSLSEWLGEGTQFIRNKSGDPVFLSKDGLRKVRFDFNKPAPHLSPHLHIEHLVNGEWQEISRVYPIDVPHK
jgi:hypothetical protein